MTTIKDGSIIIHNRDGQTIDSYVATGTNIIASTTDIVRTSSCTIALLEVNGDPSNYACNCPDNCEIGDIVEIYADDSAWIYLPLGDSFYHGNNSFTGFIKMIKVDNNLWAKS